MIKYGLHIKQLHTFAVSYCSCKHENINDLVHIGLTSGSVSYDHDISKE